MVIGWSIVFTEDSITSRSNKIRSISIYSKYLAVLYLFHSPGKFFYNPLVHTMFGRCEKYTIDSVV